MAALTQYQGGQRDRQLVVRPDLVHQKDPAVEGERTEHAAVHRRTLDWSGPYVKLLQLRQSQPQSRWFDLKPLQATAASANEMLPPAGYADQPSSSFCTKFVHSSRFKLAWCTVKRRYQCSGMDARGRRCLTGTNSGEFTLWHGSTFHYETQLQAHELGVRDITFTHNENWLVTSDGAGQVKYWKLNLELVKVIAAHRESVRGLAFSCTDLKFVTGSDDSTLKVWDFATATASAVMTGHGGDIKACDWHPSKSLVASGSKDTLIKMWDPRAGGDALQTLHAHKAPLSSIKWHSNGRWLLSSGRDHMVKVWDLRTMKELQTCKGHPRDVACAVWHPCQEEVFVSGDYDGNILHWLLSRPGPQAEVHAAHQGQVWALAYHPVGHCLASGGYDGQVRFWCRTRPGDAWLDRAPHDAHLMGAPADGQVASTGLTLGSGGDIIPGIGDVDVAAPTVAKFEMNPGATPEVVDISSQLLTAPVPGPPRPPSGAPPAPSKPRPPPRPPPGGLPAQPRPPPAPPAQPHAPAPPAQAIQAPRAVQPGGYGPPPMQPAGMHLGMGPAVPQMGMHMITHPRPEGLIQQGYGAEGPGPPGMQAAGQHMLHSAPPHGHGNMRNVRPGPSGPFPNAAPPPGQPPPLQYTRPHMMSHQGRPRGPPRPGLY